MGHTQVLSCVESIANFGYVLGFFAGRVLVFSQAVFLDLPTSNFVISFGCSDRFGLSVLVPLTNWF